MQMNNRICLVQMDEELACDACSLSVPPALDKRFHMIRVREKIMLLRTDNADIGVGQLLRDRLNSADEVNMMTTICQAHGLLNSNFRCSSVHMCIVVDDDDIHREELLTVVLSHQETMILRRKVQCDWLSYIASIAVEVVRHCKSELGVVP